MDEKDIQLLEELKFLVSCFQEERWSENSHYNENEKLFIDLGQSLIDRIAGNHYDEKARELITTVINYFKRFK